MTINAIQSYRTTGYTTLKKSKNENSTAISKMSANLPANNTNRLQLADSNYGVLLLKQTNKPVFKGIITPTAPAIITKNIPLEEKIATIFEHFNHGDLLLIGKDLKTVKNAMKESVDQIKSVIKKVLFIEDTQLTNPLAFFKNDRGQKEFVNLGKEKVFLSDGKGAGMFFNQGESMPVEIGDTLRIKDTVIKIKLSATQENAAKKGEKGETLELFKNLYTKVIPMQKKVEKSIENVNSKILDDLAYEEGSFKKKLSLSDVGGQDKAITQLKKGILLPIRNPEFYKGREINRGFILEGAPGTGKTLAAKALANDTGMNFIQINGPELESKWVGESEANLRAVFQQAKDNQPSIILFDEMDAIAKKRGGQDVYGDKFVNQFLAEMTQLYDDGDNVFILATTNRADMLDDAIVRSKRFGKVITFGLPEDVKGTKQILDIHTKNRTLASDYNPEEIAQNLFDIKASGADIAQIVEDAHDQAFERLGLFEKMEFGLATKEDLNNLKITKSDFEKAIENFKEQNMAQKKQAKNQRNPIGFIQKVKAEKQG